ncbi:uncharacterized protein DNG_06329 [Cephalotrichum gorgonifer]|uniref:Uncharacterized protein n=1 Tax=Cephalotrichum gorgonifer TaxID=2041049 RepID=A0AAE8SWC8_9PEZI|nr:uncharacterized protein DNG_06329 [Cephalotrichum gorgonifer]
MKANGVPPEHIFVLQCAIIAGKIIDRNVRPGDPSFAETILLDEQMEEIATLLPRHWWETPAHLPNTALDQDQLRDRLLVQFYYFHVRIYLHLPFIASSATNHRHVSGIACMEAARQLLQRFLLLRSELDGVPFFECKTSDFVGFTAAVVLMIGLSPARIGLGPRQNKSDWDLIQSVQKGFQVKAKRTACKISAQCGAALEILMSDYSCASHGSIEEPKEILIPYFGVVVKRRTSMRAAYRNEASEQMRIDSTSAMPSCRQDMERDWDINMDAPAFALTYQGYNIPAPIIANASPEFGDFGGSHTTDQSLWVDLDQDWSSFSDMYDGMTAMDESRLWWEG